MKVHIVDISGREYPTQIEFEHVDNVQKLVVRLLVSDVCHAGELRGQAGE